jgi:uncharacterized membrane protein (DUF441 family)
MLDAQFLNSLIAAGSVPVIVGIIQVLKPLIPSVKWYGLLAVILGILINVLVAWGILEAVTRTTIIAAVFQGIVAGLAASGAYSTGQAQQGKVVVTPDKIIPNMGTDVPK